MAVDALRRTLYKGRVNLFLPYFPGARQDRVMNSGESLTVKVYADIINAMKFDLVTILDPHSEVAPALINNCDVIDNHKFVRQCINDICGIDKSISDLVYVSPDAGAQKKIYNLKRQIDLYSKSSLVKCDKKRDVVNGNLSGFEVYADDLEGKSCLLIDDICDGGGTFIGLAEELKKKRLERAEEMAWFWSRKNSSRRERCCPT